MIQLILWLSVIWIVPLIYWMLVNESKFKKNMVLGVTFPYQGREDPRLLAAIAKFKLELRLICLALFLSAIPLWSIRDFNKNFTAWSIWLVLVMLLPYIPYIRTNHKLKQIKEKRGWRAGPAKLHIPGKDVKLRPLVSPWYFLPAILLALLPFLWDRDFIFLYTLFAVINVFCYLAYRYLYRNKAEMIDDNLELTQALSEIRINNRSRAWLLIAYAMTLYSLAVSTFKYSSLLGMILFTLNTLFLILTVIGLEIKTRQKQEQLTEESGRARYADEDDYWLGGIIYYNPKDSRLIINNRIGINSTFNLARPVGKVILGFTILILVALIFAGPAMQIVGSGNISLEISGENTLVAGHGFSKYEIPLQEIAEAEIYTELPQGMRRIAGTAMPSLAKGRWSALNIGTMRVCIDPNMPPFILIRSHKGQVYLLGTRDAEMTKALYRKLTVKVYE